MLALTDLPLLQVAIFASGVPVLLHGLALRERASATRGWTAVPGRIYLAEVRAEKPSGFGADAERHTLTTYRPDVRFEYVVDGREYAAKHEDMTAHG